MSRWDWYQATVPEGSRDAVISALMGRFELSDMKPGRPKNGYSFGVDIARGDRVLATLWWGGNPGCHVTGTGENAPEVAAAVREAAPSHRVTRCDVCKDWVEEGLFDRLAQELSRYAESKGVKINQQGDWVRGEARTLYLGSRNSPVQLVIYEKGYQAGGDPAWVRMEVRVRPSKDKKSVVASWRPGDCWASSRWLVEALGLVGFAKMEPHSVGTVWQKSDEERARAVLIAQYGRTIHEWAEELGGYEELAVVLREAVEA